MAPSKTANKSANKKSSSGRKSSGKSLIRQADIVIVGAGIVGQTLAIALAKLPLAQALNILVIDAHDSLLATKQTEGEFSPRVSAISAASQQSFEQLDVWQHIARKQAYTDMQVWDQDGFGNIEFNADEIGLEALGHIVENEQVTQGLFQTGQSHHNIEYMLGSSIAQMQFDEERYQLQLQNGSIVVAKLVVGADGANSYVRQQLGFNQTFWDYDHTAIVANVSTEHAHNLTARQAFTPSGPLAFLPLNDAHQCSIVWSQDTQQAQHLLSLSDDEFCKALAVAIDLKLGLCKLTTDRFSYPLRMRYSRQWVEESVALLGDAAHTIHPLAGQGANLGIADAMALAKNIECSIASNKPFYSKQQLRKYERYRKAEAQKVIATMEGFKQLFAGADPLKKLVRNVGLSAVNKIHPVKQFFIQQAEG
jgi:2-octaprenylphenol hydroxylase